MLLTDEQITKFQMLYKKHFGKEISRDEAYEKGARLVRLIELIYMPKVKSQKKNSYDNNKVTNK